MPLGGYRGADVHLPVCMSGVSAVSLRRFVLLKQKLYWSTIGHSVFL